MTEAQLISAVGADALEAFAADVRAALLAGDRYVIPAFGTFTSCTRRAKEGRPACRIAMWRASTELRAQVDGGMAVQIDSSHQSVLAVVIQGMEEEGGVQVPGLGRLAVVRAGKKTRLVFHGAAALNDALSLDQQP